MYLQKVKINPDSDLSEVYVSLPPREAVLYLRSIASAEKLEIDERIYTFEQIALENVEISTSSFRAGIWLHPRGDNPGRAALLLTPRLRREAVDPEKTFPVSDGLAQFLGGDKHIDTESSEVRDVARVIENSLPFEQRHNPYWRARAAFQWVREHISYAIVPRETIDSVAAVIRLLPDDKKNDAYAILRTAFPRLRDDLLRQASSRVSVDPSIADPVERAKKLMYDVSRIWRIFLFTWIGEDRSSASAIIRSGMAKCTGMACVLVALLRALSVPSDTVSGYAGFGREFGDEGGHAWALVYLAPYGWVEVDPTCSDSFDCFLYDAYGYPCLPYAQSDATLIPDDGVSRETIAECRELVAKEQFTISTKLFSIFGLAQRELPRKALEILNGVFDKTT